MEYPTTREQHAALLEAIPDPLVLVDGEATAIVDVNEATEHLLGRDHELLVDGSYMDLFPESAKPDVREALAATMAEDTSAIETDATLSTEAGRIPVTLTISPVEDADRPLLLIRVNETSALRERERRLREYTTYLGKFHTITTDPAASFEQQLAELLDLLCRHFRFGVAILTRHEDSRCEVMQVYAPELPLFPGDTLDANGTASARARGRDDPLVIADTGDADLEYLLDQFGTETGSYVGFPIEVNGRPYGVLSLYDEATQSDDRFTDPDITLGEFVIEWISYELARRQHERELERQNERLDEFASIVSHDLRNPLSVAKGYLSLATESGAPEDLENVEQALDRMEHLIEDVLTLARNGETVGEPEPVDLASVAEQAWDTGGAPDAALELADGLGTVSADESRLAELLENLFRNAVQHAGPEVTVRVGPLDRGFYVQDDGPGIDSSKEPVFDYGYTTTEDGTGFGLAIVRQIAEAHGWEVTLDESEAGGARFEFATTGV